MAIQVVNRITLKPRNPLPELEIAAIFAKIAPNGRIDFTTLIPHPAYIYQGELDGTSDFLGISLDEWRSRAWGTNEIWRHDTKIQTFPEGYIQFATAWNVPYPFIVAFANTFDLPFILEYFAEGAGFWGTEHWGRAVTGNPRAIVRLTKVWNDASQMRPLCQKLRGFDPESRE